jgi:hypothetical protein
MENASRGNVVVVIAQTDKLDRMARAAVRRLGTKLRSVRAVNAAVRRFGDKIAADPSPLSIETLEVVGFCSPTKDRPGEIEPIVLEEGKPTPVSMTYLMVAGDYWVGTPAQIADARDKIVPSCARKIAENVALSEAMMAAIDGADPDLTLSWMSCDPKTCTVEFGDDHDGKIAKRLPAWITVKPTSDPGT